MRLNTTVSLMLAAMFVACAPAKFDREPVAECTEANGCTDGGAEQFSTYSKTVKLSGGSVDILFVNDNSGSMSFEQNRMADRFNSFLSALDAKSIDYRIAMVTTDINNGTLIDFGGNTYYLTPSIPNREALFKKAIKRQETLNCETFLTANPDATEAEINANCPSGDERGLYNANKIVTSNPFSFIRSNAHLAVVVLADEDVRSNLYWQSNKYTLASQDLPQTLISNAQKKSMSLSVHSIIVDPGSLLSGTPESVATEIAQVNSFGRNTNAQQYFSNGNKTTTCLDAQMNQINNVKGSYGHLYALASMMTNGVIGNICANDYGSQLYTIGDNISQRSREFDLVCENPVELTLSPNISNSLYQISGRTIRFDDSLPSGTQITIKYKCRNY